MSDVGLLLDRRRAQITSTLHARQQRLERRDLRAVLHVGRLGLLAHLREVLHRRQVGHDHPAATNAISLPRAVGRCRVSRAAASATALIRRQRQPERVVGALSVPCPVPMKSFGASGRSVHGWITSCGSSAGDDVARAGLLGVGREAADVIGVPMRGDQHVQARADHRRDVLRDQPSSAIFLALGGFCVEPKSISTWRSPVVPA